MLFEIGVIVLYIVECYGGLLFVDVDVWVCVIVWMFVVLNIVELFIFEFVIVKFVEGDKFWKVECLFLVYDCVCVCFG